MVGKGAYLYSSHMTSRELVKSSHEPSNMEQIEKMNTNTCMPILNAAVLVKQLKSALTIQKGYFDILWSFVLFWSNRGGKTNN